MLSRAFADLWRERIGGPEVPSAMRQDGLECSVYLTHLLTTGEAKLTPAITSAGFQVGQERNVFLAHYLTTGAARLRSQNFVQVGVRSSQRCLSGCVAPISSANMPLSVRSGVITAETC